MNDTTKSALELLEQLRQERDELNILIQGLEKRLGTPLYTGRARLPRIMFFGLSFDKVLLHNCDSHVGSAS